RAGILEMCRMSQRRPFRRKTAAEALFHQRGLDRGDRLLGPAGIRPARLSHVRTSPTALTAQGGSGFSDQIDGAEAAGQVVGYADDDARLPVFGSPHEHYDARAEALLALVGQWL